MKQQTASEIARTSHDQRLKAHAQSLCMAGQAHCKFNKAGKLATQWYDNKTRETVIVQDWQT
jgi:hypothetical protein